MEHTSCVFFSPQVKYTGVDIVSHVIEDSLGWLDIVCDTETWLENPLFEEMISLYLYTFFYIYIYYYSIDMGIFHCCLTWHACFGCCSLIRDVETASI